MFEKINVAYMVGLAFAVAASVQLPGARHVDVLAGNDHIRRLRRRHTWAHHLGCGRGDQRQVWVKTLGNPEPLKIFGYGIIDNPALYSMAFAFGGIWLFSMLDRSGERK